MSEAAKLETGGQLILQSAGAALPELFVINLCASMAPMPAVPKTLKGFEKYKLYQVSRQEDGRRRFRLRLGFFTNEADAEWVLNAVRGLYPTAFTGCLAQEDLRFAGDALPSMRPVSPVAVAPPTDQLSKVSPAPAASRRQLAETAMTEPTPASSRPAIEASAKLIASTTINAAQAAKTPLQLDIAPPAAASRQTRSADTDAQGFAPAFHVARGVDLPEIDLQLSDPYEPAAPPAKHSPAAATTPPTPKPVPARHNAAPTTTKTVTNNPGKPVNGGPIHSAHVVNPPKVMDDYVPILDTTLTIRTLTKTEAEDPNRPKWFVVQLAVSEQPINLDTMPKLDIFSAYSLYSVAVMEAGKISHALRLGFFRENVSAEAVMGYLKAFFPAPSIAQISAAEHERFAESKPKMQPETEAKVVNLSEKRPNQTAPGNPAAATRPTPRAPGHVGKKPARATSPQLRPNAPARPQSFLSRLIGRQLD